MGAQPRQLETLELWMGCCERRHLYARGAVYTQQRNRTQLYIITRLCGQNLVASQRLLTELQQLSAAQEL